MDKLHHQTRITDQQQQQQPMKRNHVELSLNLRVCFIFNIKRNRFVFSRRKYNERFE